MLSGSGLEAHESCSSLLPDILSDIYPEVVLDVMELPDSFELSPWNSKFCVDK